MPLNITPLITQLEARIAAADSQSSTSYLMSLSRLAQDYNNYNTISVTTKDDLPNADSSILGDVVYVKDTWKDSFGSFFIGMQSVDSDGSGGSVYGSPTWSRIILNADSDESFVPPEPQVNALLQGTSYGYVAGGYYQPAFPSSTDIIQKYSYVSGGNSVSVGTIANNWYNNYGATSVLAGYVLGGDGSPVGAAGAVDKFPFATDTSSGLTLDLSSIGRPNNQVMSSNIGAFIAGTYGTPSTEDITTFSFANDGVIKQAGVLSDGAVTLALASGSSSSTHGYMTSGRYLPANAYITAVRRFPFAATTTVQVMGAVMVNNASQGRATQSTTHGYQFGGSSPAIATSNSIQKFSYAADTNAVQIGVMYSARAIQSTSASTTKAYSAGGMTGNAINANVIQSVPFATDTDATDVGDLLTVNRAASGHQY